MGFPDLRARLIDTTFVRFGEPATWNGIAAPVTIRFGTAGEDQKFSDSSFISQATTIRVRASEVSAPAEGDEVIVQSGPNAGTYRVIGEPTLDTKRVWPCDVKKIA
ncbi:hypothetical protein [Sphingomonas sp. CROZ-RG-20F-R02-07]|uniref:head-tail joining protein n=1 Tax=Sphingomonas sp. CROZ-RG-20F-R02-07 TaxID=2914832 RepID=UPI001F55F118|nr:hypothetical protein [Sphingomonas sp. CROZ-RG-20F-R02-07]